MASFYSDSPKFVDTLLADATVRKTVDRMASNGRTALMLAVSANKIENVKSLLANGAKATLSSGGASAISIAEERGYDAILNELLPHTGRKSISIDEKGEEL